MPENSGRRLRPPHGRLSHQNVIDDLLDITTSPFLETYGKFDRVFSFLVFHLIKDQQAAYANIAKLLNDDCECLVLAFSSFDFADVREEAYRMPKWTGRISPDMVEFGRERFSHEDIVYDVLDITTPDLSPIFSFLAFHMIRDQRAAYANIAKLLNGEGECLVVAFSSFDFVDVWEDVCRTPKWTGRIPNPRNVVNSLFNFNRVKSGAQVEAEVRDTLDGAGLQCISCEVRDHSWKYDSMDSLLDMLLAVVPFRAIVPTEEWTDFVDLWAELMHRKLCPSPREPLKLKFSVYVLHGRRDATYEEKN
ncbi:hypothetical protein HPB52_002068 [Rhipicephalus sanguineus]|uniref:Juvenile hormone acid methyltransferase n=1 Tax=Rhipicephalus sanguineus TaxID=34632 RepID=A0A9D4PJL8_RHISA|nr:hypothetical protein HPB52_002068 [Rhipicephalus sanguineus]